MMDRETVKSALRDQRIELPYTGTRESRRGGERER